MSQPDLFSVRPDIATTAGRAEVRAALGHPGACYNPWLDKTWCQCGTRVRPGDHFEHVACCGGPLDPGVWETAPVRDRGGADE